MSSPSKVNLVGAVFSVAGHAALFGGLFMAHSPPHFPAMATEPAVAPLVVSLVAPSEVFPTSSTRAVPDPVQASADPNAPVARPPMGGAASPAQPVPPPQPPAEGEQSASPSAQPRAAGLATQGQLNDYQRLLNELIARQSRYPAEARRLNLAGVTALAFRVDRNGRVLDSWVQDSSGSELLDDAALEALARAQPLPPIPAGLPSQLDFVVQIDSSLVRRLAIRSGS